MGFVKPPSLFELPEIVDKPIERYIIKVDTVNRPIGIINVPINEFLYYVAAGYIIIDFHSAQRCAQNKTVLMVEFEYNTYKCKSYCCKLN